MVWTLDPNGRTVRRIWETNSKNTQSGRPRQTWDNTVANIVQKRDIDWKQKKIAQNRKESRKS